MPGEPPHDLSTRLAIERTRVALDRTLMAWIRTAASLIGFGFAVYKFFQIELRVNKLQDVGPREFSLLMVVTGIVTVVLGLIDHRQTMRDLRSQNPGLRGSMAGVLAVAILLLGVAALFAVIFRE